MVSRSKVSHFTAVRAQFVWVPGLTWVTGGFPGRSGPFSSSAVAVCELLGKPGFPKVFLVGYATLRSSEGAVCAILDRFGLQSARKLSRSKMSHFTTVRVHFVCSRANLGYRRFPWLTMHHFAVAQSQFVRSWADLGCRKAS